MNSQCNGSFAEIKRADVGGNRRVLRYSLFVLSGFLGEPPYRPRTPTLAHVWRHADPLAGFTTMGTAETWAKPAFFVQSKDFGGDIPSWTMARKRSKTPQNNRIPRYPQLRGGDEKKPRIEEILL